VTLAGKRRSKARPMAIRWTPPPPRWTPPPPARVLGPPRPAPIQYMQPRVCTGGRTCSHMQPHAEYMQPRVLFSSHAPLTPCAPSAPLIRLGLLVGRPPLRTSWLAAWEEILSRDAESSQAPPPLRTPAEGAEGAQGVSASPRETENETEKGG
jgi:hypothetical protein